MLAICLKKLRGLKEVRLVDAAFVWTEPHSKRIKTKLTIQKEVITLTNRLWKAAAHPLPDLGARTDNIATSIRRRIRCSESGL